MPDVPKRVVIVDRHAWYRPIIEEEELKPVGAEVIVGWAKTPNRPAAADRGQPRDGREAEQMSRITSDFVGPAVTTEDEVIRMSRGAEAILVVRANISARVMDALPDLRVVGRYGIGVDNVDVAAARERGIAVVNAPGFCASEVADHTMMLLLALSRRLRFLDGRMRNGHWARDEASPMRALYTQTLGLVGFGEIGQDVARRAKPFGLQVVAHDPFINASRAEELGVRPVSLDDLLECSDYVSVHAPLTAGTRHIVGSDQLRRMKRTAFLINTSRGPLIDEVALAAALAEGSIAGAGLDVFETEPLPGTSPLLKLENVLLTPHIGGLSDEGQERLRQIVARATAEVLSGRIPEGPELHVPPGRKMMPAQ